MSTQVEREHLKNLWEHYDDYFAHKETLCHAILLVEFGLLGVMVDFHLPEGLLGSAFAPTALATVSALVVLWFLIAEADGLLRNQLRFRKIADAWGDSIRLLLTEWSTYTPTAEEASPPTPTELDAFFLGKEAIFGELKSNSDTLYRYVPRALLPRLSRFLVSSHAETWEKSLTRISYTLLIGSTVAFVMRVAPIIVQTAQHW